MSRILFIFLSLFCFFSFGSAKVVSLWEAAEQLKEGNMDPSLNYLTRMKDSNCAGLDFPALERGESEQFIAYLETNCLTDKEKTSLFDGYDWKTAVKDLQEGEDDSITPKAVYLLQKNKLGYIGLALEALLREREFEQWMPYLDNKERHYLFMLAVAAGNLHITNLFLDGEVDLNIQDYGGTVLRLASKYGRSQVVELLLKSGVDPNGQDWFGNTALHVASRYGHSKVVEVLLKNGAKSSIRNNHGFVAFHTAISYGQAQVVEVFLKNRPYYLNIQGITAFELAIVSGQAQVLEVLLKNGVNFINIRFGDRAEMTALHWAVLRGKTSVIVAQLMEVLLEYGADPNIKNAVGDVVLHLDSVYSSPKLVELLLKNGADPNIQNSVGKTALHLASFDGHTQVVELLLKNGADPNIQSYWIKNTALILASIDGHTQVVELLLKNKADPNILNINCKSAIDAAKAAIHIAKAEAAIDAAKLEELEELVSLIRKRAGSIIYQFYRKSFCELGFMYSFSTIDK